MEHKLDLSSYFVEHKERGETERHNVRDVLYAGGGKYKGHYFRATSVPSWRYDSKSYEMVQVDGDEFPPFKTTLGKSWEKVRLIPNEPDWKVRLDGRLAERGLSFERIDNIAGSASWKIPMSEDEAILLIYHPTQAIFEGTLQHQGMRVPGRSYYGVDPLKVMTTLLEYMAEISEANCDRARVAHDEAISRMCREFMAIVELKKGYAKALASFQKHQGEA